MEEIETVTQGGGNLGSIPAFFDVGVSLPCAVSSLLLARSFPLGLEFVCVEQATVG